MCGAASVLGTMQAIAEMADGLTKGHSERIAEVAVVGNSVMQHLLLGLLREVFGKDIPATPEARARAIKHLPLKLLATRPIDRAISTAGGVTWGELNAHLMLSQSPGTFIAGEMLDFEAPTGGYLLQGAFSTGVLAARGMLAWVKGSIR